MREVQVEKPCCLWAEKHGWLQRKLAWIGRVGAPDRFFAKDGRIVLVEFKAPGNVARPEQEREHRRLRDAGIEVYVIDNRDEFERVMSAPGGLV